jgi:hypothetical protein
VARGVRWCVGPEAFRARAVCFGWEAAGSAALCAFVWMVGQLVDTIRKG